MQDAQVHRVQKVRKHPSAHKNCRAPRRPCSPRAKPLKKNLAKHAQHVNEVFKFFVRPPTPHIPSWNLAQRAWRISGHVFIISDFPQFRLQSCSSIWQTPSAPTQSARTLACSRRRLLAPGSVITPVRVRYLVGFVGRAQMTNFVIACVIIDELVRVNHVLHVPDVSSKNSPVTACKCPILAFIGAPRKTSTQHALSTSRVPCATISKQNIASPPRLPTLVRPACAIPACIVPNGTGPRFTRFCWAANRILEMNWATPVSKPCAVNGWPNGSDSGCLPAPLALSSRPNSLRAL